MQTRPEIKDKDALLMNFHAKCIEASRFVVKHTEESGHGCEGGADGAWGVMPQNQLLVQLETMF